MRQAFFNRRIPTALALVLLLIGMGIVLFMAGSPTQFTGQAAPEDEPKHIQISNISDTSFTVSYITDTEVLGTIQYGASQGHQPSVETGGTERSKTHVITIPDLAPSTTYYFKIISGTHEYTDKGTPFSVQTGPALPDAPPVERTVSGSILNKDGSKAGNILVYVTAENGSILHTKTNPDGTFRLNVSQLRTKDLSGYFPLAENAKMTIRAVGPTDDARAIFELSKANPLSEMTLGQIYNFTDSATGDLPTTEQDESISFPIFREGATETQTVTIESPENNQGFTDQQPSFDGTALPNEQVEIIIQSNHEIRTRVTADENGDWEFRPETPIEPGEHTLTIRTRDKNGILRILTRSFTVYAQGSQFTEPSVSPRVTGTATPTPTRTPTPSSSPTGVPQTTESPTPTLSVTPTLEPTLTPTPTVTPFDATMTPVPTVEPTGSASAPLLMISSFGILLAGGFFYLLGKMKSL